MPLTPQGSNRPPSREASRSRSTASTRCGFRPCRSAIPAASSVAAHVTVTYPPSCRGRARRRPVPPERADAQVALVAPRTAPPRERATAAPSRSPRTSGSSTSCARYRRRAPAERSSVSASASRTSSPTSPGAKGAALATAGCARTSSTYAVRAPSRTSRRSSGRQRDIAGT